MVGDHGLTPDHPHHCTLHPSVVYISPTRLVSGIIDHRFHQGHGKHPPYHHQSRNLRLLGLTMRTSTHQPRQPRVAVERPHRPPKSHLVRGMLLYRSSSGSLHVPKHLEFRLPEGSTQHPILMTYQLLGALAHLALPLLQGLCILHCQRLLRKGQRLQGPRLFYHHVQDLI